MELGIGLALVCAVGDAAGLSVQAPRRREPRRRSRLQQPLRSARALFASRWFALGMAIAAGAWLLHVAALALAPLSTVQAVLSTGVVMLAVLGTGCSGRRSTRRQWVGVAMTATGLALLVLTLPAPDGAGSAFAVPGLIAFEAGTLVLGTLLIAAPRMGAPAHHHGVFLGAAAGVLFGVSDVAVKALTGLAGDGLLGVIASPWLPIARARLGARLPRLGPRLPGGRGGAGDREHLDGREPHLHRRRHRRLRRRARRWNLARRPARGLRPRGDGGARDAERARPACGCRRPRDAGSRRARLLGRAAPARGGWGRPAVDSRHGRPHHAGAAAAAAVVGALVAEIETELDPLVAAIGDRIREEIPDFRRLPADALAGRSAATSRAR